ncbi:MAG: phytanoyl-CoA dioxygenase family protein [Alphaproteobacteria bacterium]|nr:phytanoyl-CoA dioxygenase family protein [Alphaproteobacteria bacterium]
MYQPSPQDLAAYDRDGVICLRSVISSELIEVLARGIDACLDRPGPKGRNFNNDGTPGRFAGDVFMWTFNADIRRFLRECPLGEMAAAFMRARRVALMMDQMFVKEPHTPARSPWHQDQTYMYADGEQLCSFWVAVDPVTRASGAVEWVKGSHADGTLYKATGFDPKITYETEDYVSLPDIEGHRADYDIVAFETEPGDIVLNHLRTLHAAPGNATDSRRRAVAFRYAGDDARYVVRKKGSRPIEDPGLKPGDPMPCRIFPLVYPSSELGISA